MATGLIWTRWCFVIKPRNLLYASIGTHTRNKIETNTRDSLASVNFLLFCVGATQVSRVLLWQKSQKGDSISHEIEQAGEQIVHTVEDIAKDPKGAYEKAKKV